MSLTKFSLNYYQSNWSQSLSRLRCHTDMSDVTWKKKYIINKVSHVLPA